MSREELIARLTVGLKRIALDGASDLAVWNDFSNAVLEAVSALNSDGAAMREAKSALEAAKLQENWLISSKGNSLRIDLPITVIQVQAAAATKLTEALK